MGCCIQHGRDSAACVLTFARHLRQHVADLLHLFVVFQGIFASCGICIRAEWRQGPTITLQQVGFIQKLPTQLIAAFRATLEEIGESSLLLHVVGSCCTAVLEILHSLCCIVLSSLTFSARWHSWLGCNACTKAAATACRWMSAREMLQHRQTP